MTSVRPGVSIVGCGMIGAKRARSLGNARLVATADLRLERAENLARQHDGAIALSDWRKALVHPDVSIVIVATMHDSLAEITAAAIAAGRHVLVEKPAGRHPAELRPLLEPAEKEGVLVRVGFNHRYHPALQKARTLVDEGAIGELMFLRARYGHGGRIGYEREWRADPSVSGGGELIDQGCHLIDLSRWFLGDFSKVDGYAHTYFWDMPVDDNAFLMLRTAAQQTAFLHVSCTEWKNLFSFEIYGRTGKLDIAGLGGSYGIERIAYYKMLPEMGPPDTTIFEYPMTDQSWAIEFAEFLEDIRLQRRPRPGLRDAFETLNIVNTIYGKSGYDYHAKPA